jgi:hypothetical protein
MEDSSLSFSIEEGDATIAENNLPQATKPTEQS